MIVDEYQYQCDSQCEPQVMAVGGQVIDEVNVVRQCRADDIGTEVGSRIEIRDSRSFRGAAHVMSFSLLQCLLYFRPVLVVAGFEILLVAII